MIKNLIFIYRLNLFSTYRYNNMYKHKVFTVVDITLNVDVCLFDYIIVVVTRTK